MTNSDIITNQFVRIDQSIASLGERMIAKLLDIILIVCSAIGVFYLVPGSEWWIYLLASLAIWMYDFFWETFHDGQTPGKSIMKIRVVNQDGSRPTVGSYFMRWLLSNIDMGCCGIGILFILLTKKSQRLGDLAAGTIVIKLINVEALHISLDDFYYAKKDYIPQFEEAKNLSQAQVAVIEKTVYSTNDEHNRQVEILADKVAHFLNIQDKMNEWLSKKNNSKENFLATILHDYQYYIMELI